MASKFKKGDVVRVIGDSPMYEHCIGKVGVVVGFSTLMGSGIPVVEFDFDLPKGYFSNGVGNNVGKRKRKFLDSELEIDKEAKVLTILRQWRDSK